MRPEYLSITLKTESSLLSKEFLTYTIPELNNVSKNNLINRLKSELVNQDLVKDRFYEIEKERNTAQLNSITDALLDIEETLSNQKINIIDILDQNISTAKTLGGKIHKLTYCHPYHTKMKIGSSLKKHWRNQNFYQVISIVTQPIYLVTMY